MPDFYAEDISIDPDEFVQACSRRELKELVDYLVEDGLVTRKSPSGDGVRGYDESVYEEALLKLSGRWNMLTHAESEFISNIAKRF